MTHRHRLGTIAARQDRMNLYQFAFWSFIAFCAIWLSSVSSGFAAAVLGTPDGVIQQAGDNITLVPRVGAVVAYAIGTVMSIIGLWKLRLWMIDSDRNSLNAALFRLLVGALLIALPHTFYVVTKAVFGSGSGSGLASGANSTDIPVPKLFAYDR